MVNRVFERVLVTGGTGFIGGFVVEHLARIGIRPLVTTRTARSVYKDSPTDPDLCELDITDAEKTNDLIRSFRPQAVIHLAGVTSGEDPTGKLCADVNLTATQNLFNSLDSVGVKRVVTIGTAGEYGSQPLPLREDMRLRPVSPYAISKAKATQAAMEMHAAKGFPVTVLRVFSAYGHGQPSHMFLPQLIAHAVANKHFEMSSGKQLRDFVHVSDVAEAIVSALNTDEAIGRVINIGSGKGVALRDVARIVWGLCGSDPDRLSLGARPTTHDDDIDTEADISIAQEILKWRPRIPFVGANSGTGGLVNMIAHLSGNADEGIAGN
jgi:nucleoside-diphosphate-sugar epimerase